MSIEINTKDTKKFKASMGRITRKQMPYAASLALNNTAFDVLTAEKDALDKHIDRPTPFTKRAYTVTKARKTRLVAYVKARELQRKYLAYQVYGGDRSPKNKAIVVPVNQKVNKYGNLPKNKIKALRRQKKTFSGVPKGHSSKAPGLYRRLGYKGRKQIQLLVAYETKVKYEKRLPFYEVANTEVSRTFTRRIERAVRRAMRTAR